MADDVRKNWQATPAGDGDSVEPEAMAAGKAWFGERWCRACSVRRLGSWCMSHRGKYLSSWGASFIVHATLLIALGLVVLTAPRPLYHTRLIASSAEPLPEPAALNVARPTFETGGQTVDELPLPVSQSLLEPIVPVDLAVSAWPGPQATALPRSGRLRAGGLNGRKFSRRAALAASGGGSNASEDAVERGLKWLAIHQLRDGSWRFDLGQSPACKGRCRNSGSVPTTTGATALALLPYLGAGYTQQGGRYSAVVQKGLYYLTARKEDTDHGADFQEGTMYAQGLATMALSEAFAMTGDESLGALAQAAVDFIVHAQHVGGGWRYYPGQPGDTTVTGWQLMALKSGQLAGLHIPASVWYAAARYLDSVQSDYGAQYGYQGPNPRPSTSAVGLLCRMYLGWPHKHPALHRGVQHLARRGPSGNDMYFNYYATQVLHHYEGAHWLRWNPTMRDALVAAQSHEGHEAGSWQFAEPHSSTAGRLYNTAMAIMILEVYYRYLPLYGRNATMAAP